MPTGLSQSTRVTSNYDYPQQSWVNFMPILWNTTEGDQFQKYTKELLALCWKMSYPDASFMSDHPVCACCCDGPKLGADMSTHTYAFSSILL